MININDSVSVKLTATGRAVLDAIDAPNKPQPSADGTIKTQVWKLMALFGAHYLPAVGEPDGEGNYRSPLLSPKAVFEGNHLEILPEKS